MNTNEHALALDPGFVALREEVTLRREELAHLLTREHDLLHILRPNLLALYQRRIGTWELPCLHAQVDAARTRRKLEMARAALNRGERPDWTEIEGRLELEFLAWQQRLREAAQALEAAGRRLDHLLAPGDDRELKKLYYALVKTLHPDVNPAPDEGGERRRLWQRVQDAYACGDLEELRALALLARRWDGAGAADAAGTTEALRRQRDTLGKHIAEMERRIDEIEAHPPFSLQAQLEDDAWVDARRAEIEARTAGFAAQREASEAALRALIHTLSHGQPPPGLN